MVDQEVGTEEQSEGGEVSCPEGGRTLHGKGRGKGGKEEVQEQQSVVDGSINGYGAPQLTATGRAKDEKERRE